MDTDTEKEELQYGELTEEIIGAAIEVSNELGAGFVESVYHQALLIAISDRGLHVHSQAPLNVSFRGTCVGEFYADIVVEERVIVELKAVSSLAAEQHAKLMNYLRASDLTVGLLINFGKPKLEWKQYIL